MRCSTPDGSQISHLKALEPQEGYGLGLVDIGLFKSDNYGFILITVSNRENVQTTFANFKAHCNNSVGHISLLKPFGFN